MGRRSIALILMIGLMIGTYSSDVEAKNKYKKVGYEYKYVTTKVKYTTKRYLGKFLITYYCSCESCCGPGGGRVTASGTTPKVGRTVAVNPSQIPFGTKLRIGKKNYIAEDSGGGVGSNHIDIFVSSHSEALDKGVQYKKVWITKTKYKKKKVKVRIPVYERSK